MENFEEPIQVEISGELDLHHFSPKDLKTLIPEYIQECIKLKIFDVRIIHGKGIGNLRRTVHAILGRCPSVESFSLAPEDRGSWGATFVRLKKN